MSNHLDPAIAAAEREGLKYGVRAPSGRTAEPTDRNHAQYGQRQGAVGKGEAAIEAEIQRKGLNAPRLTPDLIDATIMGAEYHVFPGTTLTVCALTLRNGFIVTGESAAASPANFDAELGRKIARDNARNKIWALEGYLLRQRLHDRSDVQPGLFHLGAASLGATELKGSSLPEVLGDAPILAEEFGTFSHGGVVCHLTLSNGVVVTGDRASDQHSARESALKKVRQCVEDSLLGDTFDSASGSGTAPLCGGAA